MQGVSKCKNKTCRECNLIKEEKSYNFENLKTKFMIKNVVYIFDCCNSKKVYIGSTQALNNRVSLHKSNIKPLENRNLYVSKHFYDCSNGIFKIMPMYQNNDFLLLKI